jgi:hypothetical protein
VSDEWIFVEVVDVTGLTFEEALDAFASRHPGFVSLAPHQIRVDSILTGRNPVTTSHRYFVRGDVPPQDSN